MKGSTPQGAENNNKKIYKPAPRVIMPGLVGEVARKFRASRKVKLTPRAIQEDTGLHSTAVQGSLFHQLFDNDENLLRRIEKLERDSTPIHSSAARPFLVRKVAA